MYQVGVTITQNYASVTGTVTRFSVSPVLPAGLLLDTLTGNISGTPTVATASANYVVTATNGAGNTTVTLVIQVLASSAILVQSQNSLVIHISNNSSVSFQIPTGAKSVQASIVDMWGRTIWSHGIPSAPGSNRIAWDGRSQEGGKISAGLYIVRIKVSAANGSSPKILERRINYTP